MVVDKSGAPIPSDSPGELLVIPYTVSAANWEISTEDKQMAEAIAEGLGGELIEHEGLMPPDFDNFGN